MHAFSWFPASRAWFPGQGSISSLQSSDRSAGQPRWCQMLPDAVRCPQMLPDAAGGSQMPRDAASSCAVRCLQMLSGASRCCQMIPDVTDDLKCCQMLPAQMPQDARCWLMLPIPTPIPTPMPTQTLIQMPTPTTIPTPIPIQISTYNQEQYPYRFRVLPKGNHFLKICKKNSFQSAITCKAGDSSYLKSNRSWRRGFSLQSKTSWSRRSFRLGE